MHETAIREPKPENPLPWMGELHDPVSQAEVSLFIGGNRAFWRVGKSLKLFWVGMMLVGGRRWGVSV